MSFATQHSTRVPLDDEHHVTVDWAITDYDAQREHWTIHARCRLWRSAELRSGIHLAIKPLTPMVDIEATGADLADVLAHLMREAHDRCLAALGE